MKSQLRRDITLFFCGVIATATVMLLMGASSESLSPSEIGKLKILASYVQSNGNLDLGRHKIIMQGSTIYDDGSEGGGLILQGGANRVHFKGDTITYGNPDFKKETLDIRSNLNMGKKRIIMQGSSIYDDSSEGGGLILQGGANRVHFKGDTITYGNPEFKKDTLDIRSNLNMGKKRIIMQGSSIYDDSSEGGGLLIRGGANRIHLYGKTIPH